MVIMSLDSTVGYIVNYKSTNLIGLINLGKRYRNLRLLYCIYFRGVKIELKFTVKVITTSTYFKWPEIV